MKCYVIGDIHGCADELKWMVESLPLAPNDRIVFLGDYIDRGPDSKAVVAYLLSLKEQASQEVIFLKGNHEDMFLSYLGFRGNYGDMFLYNGGEATLASYGLSSRRDSPEKIMAVFPDDHLEFFRRLRPYHVTGDFLCVHAGINPLKPLAEQTEEELFWIRDAFILRPHPLPYTVLFGHTPHREVLCDLPYKIGLDTGLVYGNKLSCLEISQRVVFQIARGGRKVSSAPLRGSWERVPPATTA
ncbi:MAG TPA: metallophosphoesterase family protein [Candidatus Acidoferrales bacterium]|nr:metallophosphoesterase family protein [Candidatus Acidoferrales bacterium]